jgi:hypothetical protein
MKYLILIVLVSTQVFASEAPASGIYRCKEGNNDSVCDQRIKVSANSMKVMYEGDCGSQGPYTYYCEGEQCSDGAILVSFRDKDHYHWENLSYSIYCEMEKVK